MDMKFSVFGDARLDKRLTSIVEKFSAKPGVSVPQASGNYHQAKSNYRFWSNKKVTPERILEKHIEETSSKCLKNNIVLAIQDTTELDFSSLKSSKGLGYLEKFTQRGFKLHNAIAVSGDGLPIGILKQKYWERPLEEYGKKKDRKKKSTVDKESNRWIEFHNSINLILNKVEKVIHITDREGDIYDLLSAERPSNAYILLRIVQDRCLDDDYKIKSYLNSVSSIGTSDILIGRKDNEAPRIAKVEVRYGKVKVKCPLTKKDISRKPEIDLTIIKVSEIDSASLSPIEWYLATTLEVNNAEDVLLCVRYYCYRWLIERFFYVLKSGFQVEKLQLEEASRLENASATLSIAAARVMEMTYLARVKPDMDAKVILNEDEITILKLKYGKNNQKQLTVLEAIIMIARLGGFLARKSDGMPGLKTIWRGIIELEIMIDTLRLIREPTQNNNSLTKILMGNE